MSVQFVPVPKALMCALPPSCFGLVLSLYDRAHSMRWAPHRLDSERVLARNHGMTRADVRLTLGTIADLGFGTTARRMSGSRVDGATIHIHAPTKNPNHGADHGADHGQDHGGVDVEPIDVDLKPRVKPSQEPPPKPPLGMRPETETLDRDGEHTAADRHAAAKRQAEQDGQWQALCSRWDTFKGRKLGTTERRLSRSKGQGAELWKMREGQTGKPTRHADFLLVLDYFEAGATDHAINFRDQYDTQPITFRRNVDQWADLAKDWRDGLTSGPTAADEAAKAWDAVIKLLPRSPKLPARISTDDDREAATRAALKAIGVQQLRRANQFDQRRIKAAFVDAYTQARR